jgi:hypothetical protein
MIEIEVSWSWWQEVLFSRAGKRTLSIDVVIIDILCGLVISSSREIGHYLCMTIEMWVQSCTSSKFIDKMGE